MYSAAPHTASTVAPAINHLFLRCRSIASRSDKAMLRRSASGLIWPNRFAFFSATAAPAAAATGRAPLRRIAINWSDEWDCFDISLDSTGFSSSNAFVSCSSMAGCVGLSGILVDSP
jgi:hypothetical protein